MYLFLSSLARTVPPLRDTCSMAGNGVIVHPKKTCLVALKTIQTQSDVFFVNRLLTTNYKRAHIISDEWPYYVVAENNDDRIIPQLKQYTEDDKIRRLKWYLHFCNTRKNKKHNELEELAFIISMFENCHSIYTTSKISSLDEFCKTHGIFCGTK
jgi:hypothetical protein